MPFDRNQLTKQWLEKSDDSIFAARELQTKSRSASACSRAYYCAYQAATALAWHATLHSPPIVDGIQRLSWSHQDTPNVLDNALEAINVSRHERRQIVKRFSELYKSRILSDYDPEAQDLETVMNKSLNYAVGLHKQIVYAIL